MSCEGVLKNRENRLKNENYPPIKERDILLGGAIQLSPPKYILKNLNRNTYPSFLLLIKNTSRFQSKYILF